MSDDQLYARIKERFGFDIPIAYRRLRERGFMTLDRPAEKISAIPGDGYLYINEMECMRLSNPS
jgi:hypothetical protein